jgi:hypothetical protein
MTIEEQFEEVMWFAYANGIVETIHEKIDELKKNYPEKNYTDILKIIVEDFNM